MPITFVQGVAHKPPHLQHDLGAQRLWVVLKHLQQRAQGSA